MNASWTLIGAALVFFMQAGFAMVETGFTRAKNAGNIIMKNLMDFALGTIVFWFIGYGIMFGEGGNGFIGMPDIFILNGINSGETSFVTIIFQTVFCATAATIVSGAMAERTKFSSYCIYSLIISLVIYPISGHWIWSSDGWLNQMGFHDFAGSTAVHMVGGVAAIIGAKILGPRIGKYTKDGKAKAIPGHSLTLGALGCFILWFCWFGFNGCSTVAIAEITDDGLLSFAPASVAGRVFVTTNIAAAVATTVTMIFTWIKYKKPDVSMTLNGSLAGLVAVTAGCDVITPAGAALIGLVSGILIVVAVEFVDQKLKIDDPVCAFSVHGVNGCVGTLLTGLLAYYDGIDIAPKGLLYGAGADFFLTQLLGVAVVIVWVSITMVIIFYAIKATVGLRVTEHEEIVGLDIEEHGLASSYADFMTVSVGNSAPAVSAEESVPVVEIGERSEQAGTETAASTGEHKFTNIQIICKQSKFEALKTNLNDIGVSGITVTNVLGCGIQKGSSEFYRGVAVDMTLLPKIKVDVVVSAVPVDDVISAARKALYTGKIGDGKIFVYNVENIVKVRTGEQGFAALQGTDE
ncbi:MAG: ammonium transporter [Firmicutes bacterium]|nr:ammonium transporter [Bacillota bacterium]